MFLIHCLGVMAAVFWMSALVAHVAMTSAAERALGPAVRAGFGFVITLCYFCAAWQFASIGQAWIVAAVLLAAYAWATPDRRGSPAEFWREYRAAFALFVVLAFAFFLPLILAWTFGPFTEGGGDVSIYADTARYLTDRGLTEFGLPSRGWDDLRANVIEAFSHGPRREDSPYMNPPYPEYPALRLIASGTTSAFLYTPYAMYGFLRGATNYPVYYGLQSFVYAALILAVWRFFRHYGSRMALGAALFVAASHSLVSIFYNTYSAHGIALMTCALVLAALPAVRLFSWAGLRSYGTALVTIGICYVHYLSVIGPLVALACAPWTRSEGIAAPVSRAKPRWPALIAAAVFLGLFGVVAWAGAAKSVEIAMVLLKTSLAETGSQGEVYFKYLGSPLPAFGWRWLALLFGFISQQHMEPLAAEAPWVMLPVQLGVAAALAAVALGAWVSARAIAAGMTGARARLDVSILVVSVIVIAAHLFLVRTALYTQAKGAQNVLLCVYFAMLLPLALQRTQAPGGSAPGARKALVAVLVAFACLLAVPRLAFVVRLAAGFDRTSILEPDFFAEVERIRAADRDAFVLFEPRISADLYTSTQAFYGMRMMQTRHLVHQRSVHISGAYYERQVAGVAEFIAPGDIPHLWLLAADRREIIPGLPALRVPPVYSSSWHARRLAESRDPVLVLAADTYERNYAPRKSARPGASRPMFSFLRNGMVLLYVPRSVRVDVEMQPRSPEGWPKLREEMAKRVAAGEFGPEAKLEELPQAIALSYEIAGSDRPALRTVARFSGEYFVNVRIDGKDAL